MKLLKRVRRTWRRAMAFFSKDLRRAGSTATRIKFADGPQCVTLVGEPVVGRTEFDSAEQKMRFSPDGRPRFACACYDWGQSAPAILEGPKRLLAALIELDDAGVNLEATKIHIKRQGSGFNTEFQAKDGKKLTPEELEEAQARPVDLGALHWVEEMRSHAEAEVNADNAEAAMKDEVPF